MATVIQSSMRYTFLSKQILKNCTGMTKESFREVEKWRSEKIENISECHCEVDIRFILRLKKQRLICSMKNRN